VSVLTREDFPLNEWREHDTARCPEDGGKVELRRHLEVLGPASLAGVQVKYDAREAWDARCKSCTWDGKAELK
jgi:hypothetical protein